MSNNKKIRNATVCNQGTITFKSKLEKVTYNTLLELGITPKYEFMTFTLWPSFTPITPFYDRETDNHQKKRIENGDNVKNRILMLKDTKVVGIRYTPDFYFKYNDIDVYIESKGIENEVFYIKKKLFRKYLDDKLTNTGQHSIYFEIYTKKQLYQAIEILKTYDESLQANRGGDKMPT